MAVSWALSSNVSLTIWDIEREFQNASEAYEQWQTRHRCKRSTWVWCGIRSQDDTLAKALKLGHLVHKVIEAGKASFGSRFDEGDCMSNKALPQKPASQANSRQHHVKPSSRLNSYDSNTKYESHYTARRSALHQPPYHTTK